MHAFFNEIGRVFKRLKQKLKSFACIRILNFMNENHWQKLPAVVKIRKVLIFLYENLIVENDLDFVKTFQYIVALLFSESPVSNETVTVFKKS